MKNVKRILALLGIILLVSLYGASLIFALLDSPWAFDCLKVSIAFTIIIPILLWIYLTMFRFIKQRRNDNYEASLGKDEIESEK